MGLDDKRKTGYRELVSVKPAGTGYMPAILAAWPLIPYSWKVRGSNPGSRMRLLTPNSQFLDQD